MENYLPVVRPTSTRSAQLVFISFDINNGGAGLTRLLQSRTQPAVWSMLKAKSFMVEADLTVLYTCNREFWSRGEGLMNSAVERGY